MTRSLLAAFLALLASCSSPDTCCEPDAGCDAKEISGQEETVLIGVRGLNDEFVELEDDQSVLLVFGIQGGQHIELVVRLYAQSGTRWRNNFALLRPDTLRRFGGRDNLDMGVCGPGWHDSYLYPVYVDTATSGAVLIRVETTLFDEAKMPIRTVKAEQQSLIINDFH